MKKIIILTSVLALATASFGQQVVSKQHWTDTEYYKKSRKQKTAAWILTGVGSAVLFTTLLAEGAAIVVTAGQGEATGTTPYYLLGGACVAGGIVLFAASSKNKKKAKSTTAFFRMEKAPALQQVFVNNKSLPALGLRVGL